MKYSELINFNTIETVIEIRDADDKTKAQRLVKSYVMSDEMADKFDYGIINELQFEEVVDNKGVLIVGNYGTGKSHLMSVISSIALDKDNLQYLQNEKFSKHIEKIAGKFEVLRLEIGSVKSSLRDIIVRELENDLSKRGITYKFPSADSITSNKPSLQKMMSLFEEVYPEEGYLLVIDELLDYLRTRKEHDLMSDLGFLRELGEFIKNSRFRLVCGIQEQLFENPAFSFVSKSLNRVKDRFQQVIIRKEDTAYVVSERILSKTPEQKAKIREHLMPFCSLYNEMSERIDDFVELYPIHPSYIDIFNKVYIAEKREVLKTISLTIKMILDDEIPENAPGIISFDSYWKFIKDNYARKSEAEIKEVMDKSNVLEDKIARSFPKPVYKPMALQIINALSVYRLTTSGIDVRIGLTAENLKDDLCLFIDMPEMESEFLLSIVQTVLKEIINLVSGQFIEMSTDNGQYFLDLKKDIDYDAKISQRSDSLDDSSLNRYYFGIIYDCLDWDAEQHIPNFEIYEYMINWNSHNVFRRGYLFMGLPKERSTAQPPQDFYIYMLSPYGEDEFNDEQKSDEVMFKFKSDDKFYNTLKLYAGALSMKDLAAEPNTKAIYNKKANSYRKVLQNWLNENKNTCFDVTYKGVTKQLIEISHGKSRGNIGFKETIDMVASICLDEYFENKYPHFPKMKTKITQANQAGIMERVLKYFAGQKAQDSVAFLESFGLVKNGNIDVTDSKYAMELVKQLQKLPPKGVINYSDIAEQRYENVYMKKFNIDLYYYTAVLVALVYSGHATLCLRDNTVLTASNLEILQKKGVLDVYEFKYLAKPKQAAIDELKKLFEILDLPKGLLVNPNEIEKGLKLLLSKSSNIASQALRANGKLNEDFILWGELLIPEHIMGYYKSKISKVLDEFNNFRNKYNTVAKLNNFNMTLEELDKIEEGINFISIVEEYDTFKNNSESIVGYVSNIETMELPSNIANQIKDSKKAFIEIRDNIREKSNSDEASRKLNRELGKIKKDYIEYYFDKHEKYRLGINDQKKKAELMNSKLLANMKKLAGIESIFQTGKLTEIINGISELQVCYELTSSEMQKRPICFHCKFKPGESNVVVSGKLEMLSDTLEQLFTEWKNTLLSVLGDPLIMENKDLLKKEQQEIIDDFITNKEFPEIIDSFFVNTFNTLFSEIDKVNIKVEDIVYEMMKLGPCTVEDLKLRMTKFIDSKVKGKDLSKLRIILQKEEKRLSLVAEDGEIYGEE